MTTTGRRGINILRGNCHRDAHKERWKQTILCLSTRERARFLHWLSTTLHLTWKVLSGIDTPLSNSNRQQDNAPLFTGTTIWKCNMVFWADQIAHSRTEQHIQMGRNQECSGFSHQPQQWHNRNDFSKGRIRMWEVSRPKLTSPAMLLGCQEIWPGSNSAISWQFLETREKKKSYLWEQSNGQYVYITLTKLDEETL